MAVSLSATGSIADNLKDIRWGFAIKQATKGNYDKILKLSTHNNNSEFVSLGHYFSKHSPDNYINIAKTNGYTYFDMWKYYSIAQKNNIAWNINEMFLKTQYEMGKTFICTSADISGTYALEIETLQVMGATISI